MSDMYKGNSSANKESQLFSFLYNEDENETALSAV